MQRLEQCDSLVLDQGDFYEVENSLGLYYIPFRGEAGQHDAKRILVDYFGIGVIFDEDTEPDQYESVFETLGEARKALLERINAKPDEEEYEDLCSRCESRPIVDNELCSQCIRVLESLKGAAT